MKRKIICWWSGGITSAVACFIAINIYGKENCRIIFIDTKNEHPDTYRFKADCEKWYGIEIETITALGDKFETIQDVWIHFKTLNTASGAICSSTLKRDVRLKWQKENPEFEHQVFGFEFEKKEFNRAMSMKMNYPKAKAVFPLLLNGLDKSDCISMVETAGIEIPMAYKLGFLNNNCLETYCIKGGIGYWQKVERDDVIKFDKMADLEHYLTDLRGEPVTMLKDQSNAAKDLKKTNPKSDLVFLRKHPDYPENKCLSEMSPQEVKPLFECNGMCSLNDLDINETEKEINYDNPSSSGGR